MSTVTVELDYVTERNETPEQGLKALLGRTKTVTGIVERAVGDTGHPVAKVTGPRRAVIRLMVRNGFEPADYDL